MEKNFLTSGPCRKLQHQISRDEIHLGEIQLSL